VGGYFDLRRVFVDLAIGMTLVIVIGFLSCPASTYRGTGDFEIGERWKWCVRWRLGPSKKGIGMRRGERGGEVERRRVRIGRCRMDENG